MSGVKVTIVVPVYNVEPYIIDCMRSIINQDYSGDIECLLIDDCGTDNSMAVVEDFLSTYNGNIDFKIYRHEKNRGLSAARNTGIEHAEGDYIYFLDSDDEITQDCISKLTSPLSNEFLDFVIGGYKLTGLKISCPTLILDNSTTLRNDDILRSYYYSQWYMMACGKLCNTQFLRKNQLFFKEGLLHEDELWSFLLACLAKSMYVVNEESYIYKVREGSITKNSKTQERKVVALQHIIQNMVDFVLENRITNNYAFYMIYGKLYTLWKKLPDCIDINSREQNKIAISLRRYLCHIPYSKRVRNCMAGIKPMVLYGAVLLPVSFYGLYNSILDRLIKLHI